MRNLDSEKWLWALGLVTAAAACLSPADAAAETRTSDSFEAPDISEDFGDEPALRTALVPPQLEEKIDASGSPPPTLIPPTSVSLETLGAVRTTAPRGSLVFRRPGPPVYLVAPRQSPPRSPRRAIS